MSSGSFTSLTTSSNCILGSSSSNAHQLNGSLTIYNNGLTLNNSNITQTGSSQINTIAGSTTFNNSVTLNNGITNNIITIGQLTISYGYRAGLTASNYLQFDLPGVQTWYIWDNVECGLNLTVGGNTTFNSTITLNGGLNNNSTSNLYNLINLLNASKANLNCINFNNSSNSYSIQQIDNASNNYFRIGRTGYSDLVINSDGSVTVNGILNVNSALNFSGLINNGSSNFYSVVNLVSSSLTNANCINFNNGSNSYSIQQIDNASNNYFRLGRTGNSDVTINSDGTTSFNNSIFLPIVNGAYSLYFGYYLSQIGRCFANSNQMFFDFYSAFTFRYLSAKDGSTGLNSIFSITSGGISTPSTVTSNAISTNFITCNTIGFNYITIPSYYSSNYNLIGSQQIFYANTTSIVSQSPSFTAPITNVLSLTVGTTNTSTQLQNGIYNLQCSWVYYNSNTSNTMSFQWISYGISSSAATGYITVNDVCNEYRQETRTVPTNTYSQTNLNFALKFSTNICINTATDFPGNVIYFNAFAQYTGATGAQMIGTGQAATKFVFTRIG